MISLQMTINLVSMHYENGALEDIGLDLIDVFQMALVEPDKDAVHLVKLHRGNKVVIP